MLNIRFREKTNAWPGFVDLFSNLVIILIFLLIVFLFLWTTTNVFNKKTGVQTVAALEKANQEQAEQIIKMTEERNESEKLLLTARETLLEAKNAVETQDAQIITQQQEISQQAAVQEEMQKQHQEQIQQLDAQQQNLANQIAELTAMLQQTKDEKDNKIAELEENNQLLQSQLSKRITELQNALTQAEEASKQKEVEYTALSTRLNKALADKVAELSSLEQYQSDFYKQIKTTLGDRTTIQQSGDRFIVSSDILFPSGSYTISADGKQQLKLLANVIKDFENKIPSNVDWIIRVDGHTDNKKVISGTQKYKNNMDLSLLRAKAVVKELVKDGVSKRRLVPSGFGELHPIELGSDAVSLQKNRRIELQLTNK